MMSLSIASLFSKELKEHVLLNIQMFVQSPKLWDVSSVSPRSWDICCLSQGEEHGTWFRGFAAPIR